MIFRINKTNARISTANGWQDNFHMSIFYLPSINSFKRFCSVNFQQITSSHDSNASFETGAIKINFMPVLASEQTSSMMIHAASFIHLSAPFIFVIWNILDGKLCSHKEYFTNDGVQKWAYERFTSSTTISHRILFFVSSCNQEIARIHDRVDIPVNTGHVECSGNI